MIDLKKLNQLGCRKASLDYAINLPKETDEEAIRNGCREAKGYNMRRGLIFYILKIRHPHQLAHHLW